MRLNSTYYLNRLDNTLPSGAVSFVNSTTNSTQTTEILPSSTTQDDRISTTIDSFIYNTSLYDDYSSDDLASVAINELINKHLQSNFSVPTPTSTSKVPFDANNVTESEFFFPVTNISSLSCLNHNIPSVHHYLAGMYFIQSLFYLVGLLVMVIIGSTNMK